MTFSKDEFWREDEFFCKYCGKKLKQDIKYCGDVCRQKDSVWNWNGD